MVTAFPRMMLVAAGVAMGCTSSDAARSRTNVSDSGPASDIGAATAEEPTARDFSNYQLDMDKMRRYAEAIKGFSALPSSDTTGMSALNMSGNESSAQAIAKIESNPAARRVLSDAGLSATDYVWITAAYLQAAMTEGLM